MPVPKENVLGKPGEGFRICMWQLNQTRLGCAAGALGLAGGVLDLAINYAKERKQFGKPIAQHQMIQAQIAEMVVEHHAAQMLVYRAAWLKDQGRPSQYETSVAKLAASEAAVHAANECMKIYGSYGFSTEYPAERYYREAITVDDRFYPAKVNLAVLLSGQGRNAEAETLLREVLRLEPQQHDVEYSLALLLAEEKKYEEAAALLERVTKAEPANARGRYNLGLILQALGRVPEATTALVGALAIEPESPEYLNALAYFYLQHGDARRAEPLIARLIERHPDDPAGPQLRQLLDRLSRGAPPPASGP